MDRKIVKHGNHIPNNDTDGYMYSFNNSKGYTFNSHIHKCCEIIRVVKGKFLYTVENSEYKLSDGDVIMTNPNEFHSFSFPEEVEYQREFIHIYPDFLKSFPNIWDNMLSRKEGYFNRIPAETVKKYGIDTVFRGMYEYCSLPVPETDFMMLTYALQLITKISQIIRDELPEHQEVFTNKAAYIICKYIDTHYMENITLDKIAGTLYMSPSHVSRLFKKETGMTVKSYLNMRRITNAKSLIMQGHKITARFVDCGYSDYSTFYRAFVKYVGMTPDEFKRMQFSSNNEHKTQNPVVVIP